MVVGTILFLVFIELAVGGLLVLPLVDPRRVGMGFYRFYAGFTAALVGIAVLAGPYGIGFQAAENAFVRAGGFGILATLVASILLFFLMRRLWSQKARWGMLLAGFVGFVFFLVERFGAVGPESVVPGWLSVANAGTASLLLGSIMLAMILGHAYLMVPQLKNAKDAIRPLRRVSLVLLAALVGRILCLAGIVAVIFAVGAGFQLRMLWNAQPVFLSARLLFGIVVPAALCVLGWRTVQIESTQSATGIFYATVVLILLGEAAAVYLQTTIGIPV